MTQAPLLERLPALGEALADSDVIFDRFLDYVAEIGLELYPAQEEALLEILADRNVILATPTGSGKSLVALATHFKAMCEDKRSVYTSPVKALVNEKFFALCEAFHPDNVGLLTGDATVNRDAPILCCTAEILANIALRQGAAADISYAVIDEFHYYGDRERGVAWQIPLLTLENTRFLLMSATLGDMEFFERALSELNGQPSVTVRSEERPVPLHHDYWEYPLQDAVQSLVEKEKAPVYLVNFTQRGCHDEAQSLMSVNVTSKEEKRAIARELEGFRFDTPYGKTIGRFVRHGLGIHHGGMLPKYRRLVERLAKKGLLQVISGTDTLGVGVNIPIRTVVLTKLCKFDGRNTRILSVRDFKQICGRAGRKGFDDEGWVVALAPEHVVENKKLEARAAGDPKKTKKLVKKKPPTKGYVHYDRATFDKLVAGKPEPLASRFRVSHDMLLNVLSRPDGCRAMKSLLRRTHDRDAVRHHHARTAIQMFGSLVRAEVISLISQPGTNVKEVAVNLDLQREFSLHHTLSLYVVETIRILDREVETYPLDVLALVEAILGDPEIILRKQLDRLRGEAVNRMKSEGLEYEERMVALEKIEYPKPNAAFIYGTFDEFTAHNPWIRHEDIRPKGVARELYEQAADFHAFVIDYKLERSEGMVLRYFTDVYKALVQNVPSYALTPELDDMIEFFGGVVRGVDASLLEEWERMRDPSFVPRPLEDSETEEPLSRGITADERSFLVLVRNAVFRLVRSLATGDYERMASDVEAPPDAEAWTGPGIAEIMAPYAEEHGAIRTDPKARGTEHTLIEREPGRWRVRQILVDPEGDHDWYLAVDVDLARSDEEGRPIMVLHHLGR